MRQSPFHKKVYGAVGAVVLLIALGTIVYHFLEDWSYLDSAYFTVITLATIGYGDLAPTHEISKLFTIFFVVSGVGVFLFALTVIAEHYFSERVGSLERTVRKVSLTAIERWGPKEKENLLPSRRTIVKEMDITHRKPPAQKK